jgi:formyltetrahydrofolate deformylase
VEIWLTASSSRPKLLMAASKASHCLNDLLHRWHTGRLPVEVVGAAVNHGDPRPRTEWHGVQFHVLPVAADRLAEQEQAIVDTFDSSGADYLILASDMQVLSLALADRLSGRCINIHHSFLPSFKGARPYHRA